MVEKLRIPPRVFVVAAVLILVGIIFRLWAVEHARFTGDESDYWAVSRQLATLEHIPVYGPAITGSQAKLPGPLYYYLMAIPQLLGASPRWGSSFVAVLHVFTAWLLFLFAREARGDRAGLLALALVVFAPWDVLYADRIWGSCVVPVLGTIAIYAAAKARTSTAWQGVLVFIALVLPQLHMSTPILWLVCATILLLRPPQRWGFVSIGLGISLALLAYAHPLYYELTTGFSNTKVILDKAGGEETLSLLVPLKVFAYAVLYGTSEIGYHFARGYWTGRFDEVAQYASLGGWSSWFRFHGVGWGIAGLVSITLAFGAWGVSFVTLARRVRLAVQQRTRAALDLDHAFTIALLVGLAGGATLMIVAKKNYYPHYANLLMPMLLWPFVSGLDQVAGWKPRWQAPVIAAVAVSGLAMFSSTTRYYTKVDSLNGLGVTLGMVDAVLAEEQPVSLSFSGYNNLYAWSKVSQVIHRRSLPIHPRAPVAFIVQNHAPFAGDPSPEQRLFGPVLLRRSERAAPNPPGLVFRARDGWRSAKVEALYPDGSIRVCAFDAKNKDRCFYGDHPWQHFGPEAIAIGGTEQLVLFMHPVQGGQVRATFPKNSSATRGILRYALSDPAAQSNNRAPVELTVLQGDRVTARAEARNERGLKALRFAVTSTDANGITLEIRTQNDGARVFGFDLELYRP